MARSILLWRFFRIVPPVPRALVILCALGVVVSAGFALLAPARTGQTLPGLLVLQIFAASSGVVGSARRGYYDCLLSRGVGRGELLLGHWIASVGPGAICWVGVAVLDKVAAPAGGMGAALSTGSLVALWLASTLPWAITVSLPRFAAGLGWLVGLVTALSTIPSGQAALMEALGHPEAAAWAPVAPIVYPMGLLGIQLGPEHWRMVLPGLIVSVVLAAAAAAWFKHTDLPLEAVQ